MPASSVPVTLASLLGMTRTLIWLVTVPIFSLYTIGSVVGGGTVSCVGAEVSDIFRLREGVVFGSVSELFFLQPENIPTTISTIRIRLKPFLSLQALEKFMA